MSGQALSWTTAFSQAEGCMAAGDAECCKLKSTARIQRTHSRLMPPFSSWYAIAPPRPSPAGGLRSPLLYTTYNSLFLHGVHLTPPGAKTTGLKCRAALSYPAPGPSRCSDSGVCSIHSEVALVAES